MGSGLWWGPARFIDLWVALPFIASMLYEITIWRRMLTGAVQLLATHHELGHLSTVKEVAKRMLREHPGAGPAHHVKISEAHNGREVLVWKLDGRS